MMHDFNHWVLLCGRTSEAQAQIRDSIPAARCIVLQSQATDLATRYNDCATQLLGLVQDAQANRAGRLLLQLVVPHEGEGALDAGLFGLLRSANQENEKLRDRYARRVDFAAFIADLDIEEIMALTVGQLVDYITRCLSSPGDGE